MLAKIANHTVMRSLIFITALLISFSLHGQDSKKEYKPFIKNGLEWQTNGVDTICVVDPMPAYPGGRLKMVKYIQKNLKYPKSAIKDKIEGTVVLNFRVAKDGKIENITIVKGVRDDLDAEAIRIIEKMPKWKPGEQHGKAVNVSFNFPIGFKL
jgi:TonB family protein